MCTGLEIAVLAAGAAATAGGTLIERNEAQSNAAAAARARNDVLRQTMARQRMFEEKNRQEGVAKALERFSPEDQAKAQAEDTARRDVAIQETVAPTEGIGDIPLEGAPEIVKGNIGKRLRDVFNTATAQARLNAKPQTYNDLLMGNNIALTEGGRVLDTYNSFARQEGAMLPAQQEFAAFASQKDPSIWGPALKAAGSLAMGAAGGGYLGALGGGLTGSAGLLAPKPVYTSPLADLALRNRPA